MIRLVRSPMNVARVSLLVYICEPPREVEAHGRIQKLGAWLRADASIDTSGPLGSHRNYEVVFVARAAAADGVNGFRE